MTTYDVIIVGAGSIGLPIAMALGEARIKILVIDKRPSPGQGENKHAIGGIRATHSDPPKILTCLRSLEIFSTWEERYGDDIHWLKGGYTFPVYRKKEAALLKSFLPGQKKFGLNIDFLDTAAIQEIIPGITPQGYLAIVDNKLIVPCGRSLPAIFDAERLQHTVAGERRGELGQGVVVKAVSRLFRVRYQPVHGDLGEPRASARRIGYQRLEAAAQRLLSGH